MRRVFTVPRAYRRHIEASIAMAMDEIARDMRLRGDSAARDAKSPIPCFVRDDAALGRVSIVVEEEPATPSSAVVIDGVTIQRVA